MQLQRGAVGPLRVGHLEQIDLRYRARNVEQRVDSSEAIERRFHDCLRRLRLAKIRSEDLPLRAD